MTVLAYRDGVLAADSGAFMGATRHAFGLKIARAPDGTLYGFSGVYAEGEAYMAWVLAGAQGDLPSIRRTKEADTEDAIHILRVRPGRAPERLTGYGIETWHDAPYAAIGAAAEFALGALHAGATAVQAVEAAIAHSQWAHGPVRSVSHQPRVPEEDRP